jgi:hypothetical protein
MVLQRRFDGITSTIGICFHPGFEVLIDIVQYYLKSAICPIVEVIPA